MDKVSFKKMKPSILVVIGGPTEHNVLAPIIRILSENRRVSLRMFTHNSQSGNLAKELSIDLIDEVDLFYLLQHRSTGLLLLAADFNHPYHCIGHRSTGVARLNGVPSLSVQHGLFLNAKEPFYYRSFTADKMAVWGPTFRDILINEGSVSKRRLMITGNPAFDDLLALDAEGCKTLLKDRFGIKEKNGIALVAIATHYMKEYLSMQESDINDFVTELLNGCSEHNIQVIVKPHPNDVFNSMKIYDVALKRLKNRNNILLVSPEEPICTLIAASDIVISQVSTVAFESLVKGKLVLCVRSTGMEDIMAPLEACSNRLINIACSLEDMKSHVARAIEKALEGDYELANERGPFARDLLLARQGRATQRVARLALEMVRPSSRYYAIGRNIYRKLLG